MTQIPHVVLRCSRLVLFVGMGWGVGGIMEIFQDDPSMWWAGLQIGLTVCWFAIYLSANITVTEAVVIVRRGLVQDIYPTQLFIDHEVERRGLLGRYTVSGEKLRLPFLVRPTLILESIMKVKGIERPVPQEQESCSSVANAGCCSSLF